MKNKLLVAGSKWSVIVITLILVGVLFSQNAFAQVETSTILTAERISEPIVIDGFVNETAWSQARELVTLVKDGSIGRVDVALKALYDEENIYFLVTWEDPTESIIKGVWTSDGSNWTSSEDEDRLSFIWNIDGSINGFDIAGCAMLCHGDRMHTNGPGEKGDLWHWKASRSNPMGYSDDSWIDDTIIEEYTYDALEAAFHHDSGSEMYEKNINEAGDGPKYFEPSPINFEDERHLFQREVDGDNVVLIKDVNVIKGMTAPGYIITKPSGSRADLKTKGVWKDGRWNVEFKRKLKTGQSDDVQFDTTRTYRFGIALMDNTGGFEGFGKGHSFDLGARTLEFGGRGSKEVVELALVRDYLVISKAYMHRGESGLALSTISDALVVFNRVRDPVADIDPDLFITIRNGFVDSRRVPSLENIERLMGNVDLAILTFQGKRNPPEATLILKVLVLWGKFGVYAFIALAVIAMYPIYRMFKIIKKPQFHNLGLFMFLVITPIFLEGVGRLGALLKIPILQNFSFTTSEFVTLFWAAGMFIALYIGRRGFNEIDKTLNSLEYYGKELESKMEELRRSQQQLLRSERLASIGQLAASMAHELRNPLGVIKNVSYFLKMTLGKSDKKVDKHLKILDQELNTSNKIITDLLDFSSGKQPVLQKSDINSIIKNALSKAKTPEGIEVDLRLTKKIPALMADNEQLQRVFFNMVVNAFQAMPEGGTLKVTTRIDNGYVIIQFTDNGIGISENKLNKIFEPLFTMKAKGIGLGLALSKQIIEMHGGVIAVESESGRGTVFTVKLPIKMTQ